MRVRLQGPQQLHGRLQAPASKAYTHRALLASLLTPGETIIRGALTCDDTINTFDAIREMGARVREKGDELAILGVGSPSAPKRSIDCSESGATLRFLTALAGTCNGPTSLLAKGGLGRRPIEPLLRSLKELGSQIQLRQTVDYLRLVVQGPLRGGSTSINGDISSQFISGLLLAAPLARNDVELTVRGRLESRPYVNLTLAIQKQHGITVEHQDGRFRIPAPQEYKPTTHQVTRDFSSAAFLIAAGGTAGDEITLLGFEGDYLSEPDSVILKLFPEIGLKIEPEIPEITVSKSQIQPFQFEASDHPDLVPVLEVLAAQAKGRTRISGVKRLTYKESDRLATVPTELAKMGAKVKVEEDLIQIDGTERLVGQNLSSHRDHRVAMACATAALAARGHSVIEDAEVVSKSYPAFFNDLEKLGARLDVE